MMKWKTCFQISTACSHNHFEEMKTFEDVFSVLLFITTSSSFVNFYLPERARTFLRDAFEMCSRFFFYKQGRKCYQPATLRFEE